MLSKVSTTLGLSSASMAASESEFSISSSSKSPSPGAASPPPPLSPLARSGAPLNGVAPAGAAGGDHQVGMQLLGRHRAIHLTPPMLWIFRFMTLAWAVLFPRGNAVPLRVSQVRRRVGWRRSRENVPSPPRPCHETRRPSRVRGQQNPCPAWLLALLELQRR